MPSSPKKTKKSRLSSADVWRHATNTLTSDNIEWAGESGAFLTAHTDNFAFVPDSSVDLVLTDPPFNIAQDTNFHTWGKNTINSYRFDGDKGWDTYSQEGFIALLNEWAAGFARVLRNGGTFAVFCADEYLSHFHHALETAGLNVRRTLTWRKPNAVPINRKAMMMSSCEYVLIGVKGSKATFNADIPTDQWQDAALVERVLVADKVATLTEKYVREAVAAVTTTGEGRRDAIVRAAQAGMAAAVTEAAEKVAAMYAQDDNNDTYLRGCVPNAVNFTSKGGKRLHPTEKPTTLLRYLIELLSRRGDVVLDPFGGSGSTGEAAIETQRFPIVVEMDSDFYPNIRDRLTGAAVSDDGTLPFT